MSSITIIGKIIAFFCRILPFGTGTALPGLISLKLNPTLINQIVKKNKLKSVIITGTNGKTTTTRLLGEILKLQQIKFIHNRAGSNLLRGVASTLINQTDCLGRLKSGWAIWEIDEASVKEAVKQLKPQIILFTNLSRDQLDRYGEIDLVKKSWLESLNFLPKNAVVITNKNLARDFKKYKKVIIYDEKSLKLKITDCLSGKYNQNNVLAAKAISQVLKFKPVLINQAIHEFRPAFGRGEIFTLQEEKYQILLVKNPAGFNAVWQMLAEKKHLNQPLLIILNDLIADGTDVSWIWDLDFNYLKRRQKPIIVSGIRTADMALRLKYGGVQTKLLLIEPDIKKAFQLLRSRPESPKYILPTYTAMLKLRKVIFKKKFD